MRVGVLGLSWCGAFIWFRSVFALRKLVTRILLILRTRLLALCIIGALVFLEFSGF